MILFSIWLYSVIFVGTIYVFCQIFDRIRIAYYIFQLPTHPKAHPLFRNLFQFNFDSVTLFKTLREWSKNLGSLYGISFFITYGAVNISGAEEFEIIAASTRNIRKSRPIYHIFELGIEQGLLTSSGDKWQTRRKIIEPAFHHSLLQQFVTVFNDQTKILIRDLVNETRKPWTDITPYIEQCSLYSIAATAVGKDLTEESEETRNILSAIHQVGKGFAYRLMRPWLHIHFIYYYLSAAGRKEKRLIKMAQDFAQKVINEKIYEFKKIDPTVENIHKNTKKQKLSLLDSLVNAKVTNGLIDDHGIQEEMNTLIVTGYETVAVSLGFTLMLLANYRDYQERIFEEIINVLGDRNPDLNDLNELTIMDRFIKESLRLYPSAPAIGRTLDEDVVLNGYFLPKNTDVIVHIFDIQRNEKYWPDPNKFDPDRFLPGNCENRHPYAYCPFSAGPRSCIVLTNEFEDAPIQNRCTLNIGETDIQIFNPGGLELYDNPNTILNKE